MAETNISRDSRTKTTLTIKAYCKVSSSANKIHRVKFYCDGTYHGDDTTVASQLGHTVYWQFTGLRADTSYYFEAQFLNINGTEVGLVGGNYSTKRDDTPTKPSTPGTISYSGISTDSVTVSCSSVSRADGYNLYRNINGSASWVNYRSYSSFYVTGLSADTSYKYGISAENDGGESDISWGSTFTTDSDAPTRPNNWAWEFTISSGNPFYQQGLATRSIYLMRAAHWNAFTSRINGFREYRGLVSYSFTSASTSTTEIGIRNCINQAIDAINSMLPSYQKMNNVYSGDDVSASIFTNMRDKLNSIS